MYNVFAWNNVDGYSFVSFQSHSEVITFCNKFGVPLYVPCAAEFAAAIEEAKKNTESGCVTTVLLITEGTALHPYESLMKWEDSFAWCNNKE